MDLRNTSLNAHGTATFESLSLVKGFKLAHLNVRSLLKKIDQVRLLLQDVKLDVFTVSESWLQPHLDSSLIDMNGYRTFRLDRDRHSSKGSKRGGGLVTFIGNDHASSCEILDELNVTNEHIETQWIYVHRPNCENVITCNLYRPPAGDLTKALAYVDECLKTINLSKVDVFIMGDMNVDYKNKKSPKYKRLNFFAQSNGLSQHIQSTTRNTDKTNSLIDLLYKLQVCTGGRHT